MAKRQSASADTTATLDASEIVELAPSIAGPESDSPLKQYRVSLPFHSTLNVEAADEAGAVNEFKRIAGIISTDHAFSVALLG